MTKKERENRDWQNKALATAGISADDAAALRHISQRLHSWDEKLCGSAYGCVEVDDDGKAYYVYAGGMGPTTRSPIRNMGRAAERRVDAILAKYPTLKAYHQTDPRGAALYIIRPGDVPEGENVESYYNNGIVVY